MKYLITGGAGFIGSHLVKALMEKREHVTVLDDLSGGNPIFLRPFLNKSRFRFIRGSLLNPGLVRKALIGQKQVLHLAANSDLRKSLESPTIDFERGIRATFILLEGMRDLKIRKLTYLSGSGVYGDRQGKPYRESDGPYTPESMYGAAKLSSEALISAYAHLYGIHSIIYRPANVVGGHATHGVIFDLIRKLHKNSRALEILGNGFQTKAYLHVSDLIEGLFHVEKKPSTLPVRIFNIGTESTVTVRWIVQEIFNAMGLKKVKISWGRSAAGWKGDIPKYSMDLTQIKKAGWRPKLDSEQAVRQTIHEILSEGIGL